MEHPKYIYWQQTGGGIKTYRHTIYFNPKEGRGEYYSIEGKPKIFSWVNPEKSNKCEFNLLPEEIQFSLLHYGRIPHIEVYDISNEKDLVSLINQDKTFKIITKDMVESYIKLDNTKLKSLEHLEEFKKEINLLYNVGIPNSFCTQIFSLYKYKEIKPIHGEIGISTFLNGLQLYYILTKLSIIEPKNK